MIRTNIGAEKIVKNSLTKAEKRYDIIAVQPIAHIGMVITFVI